jgi:hypothetical protein
MSPAQHAPAALSSVVVTDQLQMAGLVLGALESGRLRMNAADYREIAAAAAQELELLDSNELEHIGRRLPPALLLIVENVLCERAALDRLSPAVVQDRRSWPVVIGHLCRR